jgi:hypothetical protein
MNRADACSAALPAMIRMLLDLNRIRLTGMVMAGRQPTALHHGRIGEGLEERPLKNVQFCSIPRQAKILTTDIH